MRKLLNKIFSNFRTIYNLYKVSFINKFSRNIITNPLSMDIFITYRCNLKCSFCWQKEERKSCGINDELSLQDIKNLVNDLKKHKINMPFNFSGGELFVKKDIFEIFDFLKKENIDISLATNGTLLNSEKIKKVMSYPNIKRISFSIDGDAETHDSIRGIKGTYKKVVDTMKEFNKIKRANKSKSPELVINFVVTAFNIDKIEPIVKLAKKFDATIQLTHLSYITPKMLNLHKKYLQEKFPDFKKIILEGATIGHNFTDIEISCFEKVKNKVQKYYKNVKIQPDFNSNELEQWCDQKNNKPIIKRCFMPITNAIIFPTGDVIACPMINYSFGNIKNQNFMNIWKGKKRKEFIDLFKKNKLFLPGCQRCSCGLLPAR